MPDNEPTDDPSATGQPMVSPVSLTDPALLALGYTFNSLCSAELGFHIQLIKMFDLGYHTRELAAACNLLPKQVAKIIDTYGPGIRDQDGEEKVKCKNSYQTALHITSIGGMTLLSATVICPECSQAVQIVPDNGDSWIFKSHNTKKREGSSA